MAKLTISTISSGYASVAALNAAFDAIEAAMENTLSRDGTSPNSMAANLDMDSNRILNLPDPASAGEPATKSWTETNYGTGADASATAAAASAAAAAASESAAATSETNAAASETAAAASAAFLPSISGGDALKLVRANAGETAFELFTASYGDASGPASAVNERIAVFDGTTGKLLKDGGVAVAGLQTYDADTAKTDVVQSFSVAQRGTVSALTSGTTITPDFAAANNFSLTLAHNATLANPTNLTAGQHGSISITNTTYTLAYGSYWKFEGVAPTLPLSDTSLIAYYVESTTRITATLIEAPSS